MTRKDIHDAIDEVLTQHGHGEKVDIGWGEVTVSIKVQGGKPVLKVRERETDKEIKAVT